MQIIHKHMLRRLALVLIGLLLFLPCGAQIIRFVYASDSHYGLYRPFRGQAHVSSSEVNRAMIDKMNQLPALSLPMDGGVLQGEPVGNIDFVIHTGDITNRMEKGVQTADDSWRQFEADWYGHLHLTGKDGAKSPLYLLPGNHDVSNAIGHPKLTSPVDATGMVEIYRRMMPSDTPPTVDTYSYQTRRVHYSFTFLDIHFLFVNMWPDTREREWISRDLQQKPDSLPVLLFTHDVPDVEAKHLINPNGTHDINKTDKFENLLCDTSSVTNVKSVPHKEQKELIAFLRANPCIKAYFHGHTNYNEFYTWKDGKGKDAIPCFRVDSPMKGELSSADEQLVSFQLITIDVEKKLLTARECLWNVEGTTIEWGESITIGL